MHTVRVGSRAEGVRAGRKMGNNYVIRIDNSRELTPAVKITKPGDMGEDHTGSQAVNS